MEDHATII